MESQSAEKAYQELSEKEYNRLKVRLQELEKQRKGKKMYLLAAFCSLIAVLMSFIFVFDTLNHSLDFSSVAGSLLFGGVVGAIASLYVSMVYEMREGSLRRKILEYEADNTQDEVTEDIFENSIKISYKYLDQYYLQTREQAQRGFFVTVCVAVFGALLIFVGVVAMFLEKVQPSYITCASGVITEFIAAVFFYLYNKTVSSMSKYHNKLVLSQNVSIALKVADSLPPDEKAKTKNLIITELLKDINTYLVKNDDK